MTAVATVVQLSYCRISDVSVLPLPLLLLVSLLVFVFANFVILVVRVFCYCLLFFVVTAPIEITTTIGALGRIVIVKMTGTSILRDSALLSLRPNARTFAATRLLAWLETAAAAAEPVELSSLSPMEAVRPTKVGSLSRCYLRTCEPRVGFMWDLVRCPPAVHNQPEPSLFQGSCHPSWYQAILGHPLWTEHGLLPCTPGPSVPYFIGDSIFF